MMKTLALVAPLVVVAPLSAQEPALPSYTATPIRPAPDAADRGARTVSRVTPDGLQLNGGTIRQIWQLAYPSEGGDPLNAPEWLLNERFDFTVRFEKPPTNEQRQAALRAIFADQLKLKVHYETRETPTYDLVVVRSDRQLGRALRPIAIDCDALIAGLRDAQRRGEAASLPGPASNGAPTCGEKLGNGSLVSGGMRMARLAGFFRNTAGRLIVDKTGLDGFYEVAIEWSSGGAPAADAAPDPRPTIFTALQEQLGLKLEPSTTPIQVVVIDHIERPTGN